MQYLMFLLVCAAVALSVTAAAPRSSSSDSSAGTCSTVTSAITCTSTGSFVMCDAPGDITAISVGTLISGTCTIDNTFGFIGDDIFVSGGCAAIFDVTYEVCTSSDSSS